MSRKPRKRDRRRARGYTLVEVVFSILLAAVMLTSVMTVSISVRSSDAKADRKMLGGSAGRQLDGMLKNFKHSASYLTGPMPIDGPNAARAGAADKWKINGMEGSYGAIQDLMGDVDALAPGTHRLRNFLPPWFEALPPDGFGAYAEYDVIGGIDTSQEIRIRVEWQEP